MTGHRTPTTLPPTRRIYANANARRYPRHAAPELHALAAIIASAYVPRAARRQRHAWRPVRHFSVHSLMADFTAIAAAGQCLERLLSTAFADPSGVPVPGYATRAMLVQSDALRDGAVPRPSLALLLHHIAIDRSVRNTTPRPGQSTAAGAVAQSIPIALHYLLIPYAADAVSEQHILGRTLQVLEQSPILSGPLLTPPGIWAADDALPLTAEDLTPDERRRLLAAVSVPHRACLTYILRLPRFDGSTRPGSPRAATQPVRPVVVAPRA